MIRLRSLSFAWRVYLLALALRLIPVLLSINLAIGLDDMFQYDMLARSLVSGNGFRWYAQEDLDLIRSYIDLDFVIGDYDPNGVLTSFRAPAYPAFLALIYSLSGLQWRFVAARLVQAFLGATLAPLTFALAKKLFPDTEQGPKLAAVAIAAYPMLVIYPLALATENLFFPLLSLGLLLTLRAGERGATRDYLLAGAVFGLAILTRSVISLSALLVFLWLFFITRQRRGALLFGLSILIVVTPWVLRNSLLHERFTFVENSLGYNLHMGFHPEGSGTFQYGISLELLPYLDDAQRNELGIQAGLEFIRQDPARVPVLMLNKLGYFFSLERRALTYFYTNGFFGAIPKGPLIGLFLLFTLPFALIATLGAAALALIRWNQTRVLLLLFGLAYLFPHLLLMAEERFHLALLPLMAILAGHTWINRNALLARATEKRWRLALLLVLVGLLWLNWGLELWRDAEKLAVLFGPDGYQAGFPY